MRRWWNATEGIRVIMVCFLIMAVGMTWMAGCGGSESSEEVSVQEPERSWEQEEAEEGYYFGGEAAKAANKSCEAHGGARELHFSESEGLEVILCEDGYVGSPYE